MGNKISKIIVYSITTLLLAGSNSAQAQFFPHIPTATMQAAKEAEIVQAVNAPTSEVVRVGIGTSNFGTYVYSELSIYGTGSIQLYDNKALVGTYQANQNLRIKRQNNTFSVFKDGSTIPDNYQGPIQVTCPSGLLGVKGLSRAGKPALYHGAFEFVGYKDNNFNLVNMIEVEEYLKGVVPNEMPVSFGLEALKAQSVAARNYVLSPRVKASNNYDVVDSVASQVYFGANTEKELSNRAVEETEGVVAIYNWELILAQYSSTAGGYTESFSNAFSDPKTKTFPAEGKPYLIAKPDILSQMPLNTESSASLYYKSRPDSYDVRSPYFRWEKEWNAKELHDILQQTLVEQSSTGFVKPAFNKGTKLDDLVELRVKRRGESGKIIEMEIVTKTQTYKVEKELVIRRLMYKSGKALPSANVVFENIADDYGNLTSIHAYGGGFGHGVGLSQYGAGFMGSELNLPFDKIIKHYYTGVALATKPIIVSSENSQNAVKQSFYSKDKYANLVIDNKFQVSKLIANINGREYSFDLPTNILGKRITKIDISNYIKRGKNTVVFYYPQNEGERKAIRLYVELVKKDDNNDIW